MSSVLDDFRIATRVLIKRPAFTGIALATLALGIGANTALFSVANALFLRPLPYPDAARLVEILETAPNGWTMPVDYTNFTAWRRQMRSLQNMAVFQQTAMNLTGLDVAEQLQGLHVSASFFPTIGVKPMLGREFLEEEDRPNAPLAAVISHALWQGRLGGNAAVIGTTLRLNGRPHTVIGVLPAAFRFYEAAEVYVPFEAGSERIIMRRGNRDRTKVIARCEPGAGAQQVRAELASVYRQLERESPETNRGVQPSVTPLRDRIAGKARTPVLVLLGAVGLLLLIALVNVANMLLARAAGRSREMAIRAALGAGRGHVLRQLLTEGLVLSLGGAVAGILIAAWSMEALRMFVPADLSLAGLAIDARVVAFTAGVSVLAAILLGLTPAFRAFRLDLAELLRDGARTSTSGRSQHRLGRILVVAEVALALVLVIGAGLLIRSFIQLMRVDPGIRAERVLTMRLNLPLERYGRQASFAAFCRQLVERVSALPGIQHAGLMTSLPLSGASQRTVIQISSRATPPGGELPAVLYHAVTPGYFRAIGIPLRKGRYLEDSDTETSNAVAVIGETLARRHWPDENPIGKQVRMGPLTSPSPWMTIVGIVGDARHYGLQSGPEAEYYFPAAQFGPWTRPTLVVRTATDPLALAAAVRRSISALDNEQAVVDVRTMQDYVSGSVASRRANMILLGLFAATALALAAAGVYGVVSESVTRRIPEVGIRIALGASRANVLRMLVGQEMPAVAAGFILGLAASAALGRVMESLLYGITPRDPLTLITVSLVLWGVAFLASYLPARRAASTGPIAALRFE